MKINMVGEIIKYTNFLLCALFLDSLKEFPWGIIFNLSILCESGKFRHNFAFRLATCFQVIECFKKSFFLNWDFIYLLDLHLFWGFESLSSRFPALKQGHAQISKFTQNEVWGIIHIMGTNLQSQISQYHINFLTKWICTLFFVCLFILHPFSSTYNVHV